MNIFFTRNVFFLLLVTLLMFWTNPIFAQNTGNNDRYNLAVYATGTQDNQPLTAALQTIVQNRTITKLTGEGNYRLIERSGEFLKEIQNEQKMQQSGDVADGQIAEIGAGYGAQKICVVSVTIIGKYLYIATRIVDVATKTSYESGDADASEYTSIPELISVLNNALNKMIGKTVQHNSTTPTTSTAPLSSTSNVGQLLSFEVYKHKLNKGEGVFMEPNSLAYKKYKEYKTYEITGALMTAVGGALCIGGAVASVASPEYTIIICPIGIVCLIPGIVLLNMSNTKLRESYQYYLNGDHQTFSMQFYPYYAGNNTFGAGLSLWF